MSSNKEDQEEVEERVRSIAKSVVEKEGLVIYDIFCYSEKKGYRIQLMIDRLDESVSVDDCAVVSRGMSVLLDSEEPFTDNYSLEVSSPGIERRLKSIDEYERFLGETVLLYTKDGSGYKGVIDKVEGDKVTLDVDGECVVVEFEGITKGQIKVDVDKYLK